MRKTRDYIELVNSIDRKLPVIRQKEIVCDALLEDLHNLKGRDLAPYLLECAFDTVEPGTRFVLKFPLGLHKINPLVSQVESDGIQGENANS